MAEKAPSTGSAIASCQAFCVAAHSSAGSPEPEEEHHHHAAPAPQVAQPPGRHRTQAEHQEGAGAIGHQVFPAREAELDGDAGHRGGEDQQEHVVQRMAQVEQE
jgi:hypothetical protein